MDAYTEVVQYVQEVGHVDNRSTLQFDDDIEESAASRPVLDAIEYIIDSREWDVPYHIRVAIDKGTFHRHVAKTRHPNWKMVHRQSESWTNHSGSH